jgi:hypothetical protein
MIHNFKLLRGNYPYRYTHHVGWMEYNIIQVNERQERYFVSLSIRIYGERYGMNHSIYYDVENRIQDENHVREILLEYGDIGIFIRDYGIEDVRDYLNFIMKTIIDKT